MKNSKNYFFEKVSPKLQNVLRISNKAIYLQSIQLCVKF
jgi:hypothetical protein